jgi:aspartyl-tRNA(Asn)/glutamyl-tRNA(Gln) amidotransferase subunit C
MPLSREQVEHVAHLARLSLSEEEIECYREQLSAILDYMAMLNEVDTSAIPPTATVLPLRTVLRDDVPQASLPREEALANAPRREGDFFQVHAILEEG